MLTLYVCPKRQPRYLPSRDQLRSWFASAVVGGLIHAPELEIDLTQPLTSTPMTFAPGLGVIQLFNQDARDALLPAELTFESLELCLTTSPTLLPPEMIERSQFCPQCGDEISDDALSLALAKLEFVSFERSAVFCQSCQDELSIKSLEFDPNSVFANFWIRLDEVGSSRLNPVLLKDWEHKLGCTLTLLIDQKESDLQEIASARQESEVWRNFEQDHPHFGGVTDDLFGADSRQSHRESRYQRRRQNKKRKRRSRSESQRDPHHAKQLFDD